MEDLIFKICDIFPDPHFQVLVILQRMLKLLSGAGLSINEQHVYCGDYIYSGHTMTLVMTFLIIKECESMCGTIYVKYTEPALRDFVRLRRSVTSK